jgi:hypothetical protein
MSRSSARVFFPLLFASLFISVSLVALGQNAQKPLRASQVMALQAGGGLPENVAHDIELRGTLGIYGFVRGNFWLADMKLLTLSPGPV